MKIFLRFIIPCLFFMASSLFASEIIKIEATTLFDAYTNNEISAEEKYGGKEVEVSGVINKIFQSPTELDGNLVNSTIVYLGGQFPMGLACVFFEKNKKTLASGVVGKMGTIRGINMGKTPLGNLRIEDCRLISE